MTDLLVREVRAVPLDLTVAGQPHAPGHGDAGSRPVDILIHDGRVAAVGTDLPAAGAPELAGEGRWVVPGMWDHHVHTVQWALVRSRPDLSVATSVEHALSILGGALAADPAATGPLIGWGHRSAGWPQPPTTADLDGLSPVRPVVLISGDGHHGWLNSAAMALMGVPYRAEVIQEEEWFAICDRLGDLPGAADQGETAVLDAVRDARAHGVVGLVDLDFSPSWDLWPGRLEKVGPIRVRTGVYPGRLAEVLDRGWRSGDPLPGTDGWAVMGPLKVISDGSLNTRTAWCCEPYAATHPGGSVPAGAPHLGAANYSEDELRAVVELAHGSGLEVALHAIGDRAVRQVLDVLQGTGARGSIEHAQLVDPADLPRLEPGPDGQIIVIGFLPNCHSLPLYWTRPNPIDLDCPLFKWDTTRQDEMYNYLVGRVSIEPIIYMAVDQTGAFDVRRLPFEWTLLDEYPRPFDGKTVQLFRVSLSN